MKLGEWAVPEALGGRRLDEVLAALGVDPAAEVFVDGRRARDRARAVRAGARIVAHAAAEGEAAPAPLVVLFEDEVMIVLDKAPGDHVNETETSGRVSLIERLRAEGRDAFAVHRLDRETSGVLVVAKGAAQAAALSRAFEERRVAKRYLAVVTGSVAGGVIDAAIGRDPRRPRARAVVAAKSGGKPARTVVRVLSRASKLAVVEASPETGRTHQIRVHLAHAGAPLFGDLLYGGVAAVREGGAVVRAGRVMLHASEIVLPGGARFTAPLPPDMQALRAHGLAFEAPSK